MGNAFELCKLLVNIDVSLLSFAKPWTCYPQESFILSQSLLHIVPFCEGPNEKPEGFMKQKQKT
jgi:hypothetical protein